MNTNRKFALLAGISIITMAIIAIFCYGYAHSSIVDLQNTDATLQNLQLQPTLFKLEIWGWIVILICDVFAALALYLFFKKTSIMLSVGVAFTRIIYTFIFGFAIYKLVKIAGIPIDPSSKQSTQLIMSLFNSFETIWSWALILFGLHLFILGKLTSKSRQISNFWSIMLYFAAGSYTLVHCGKIFLPELHASIKILETILSLPMAFAEVGFGVWLLIRGGKRI